MDAHASEVILLGFGKVIAAEVAMFVHVWMTREESARRR